MNAYVGPALARYLAHLGAKLRARGYRGDVLVMQSHGGVAPIAESQRLAAGAVLSGPAGGVAAGRYCVQAPRHEGPDHVRHGRNEHGHRAAAGRRADALRREDGRDREGRAAEPRHPHARRGRRLDRARGRRRHPARRPRERRRRSRARVLRAWRHGADRHRRRPRARLPRSRELLRRAHRARHRRGLARGRHDRGRAPRRSRSPPPRASIASSTPTWRRASSSCPCGGASIRAASRWWRSAVRPDCTSHRWRGSSRSAASSSRPWHPCSPRGACSRPTCATSSCART